MPLLKKKDAPLIPPVDEQARNDPRGDAFNRGQSTSPIPGYRSSNSRTYVQSRDGDPYARPPPQQYIGQGSENVGLPSGPAPGRDRYNRNNSVGDPYSRGRANLDEDRAKLFAGYDPEKHKPSSRFTDGPSRESYRDDGNGAADGDESETEAIKKETRFTKQESVNSTRNALRIAREAEETARNTLGKLGDQSEKLANTERHLDIAKGHANRVEDKQDELKQLNRSIFRPVITFNKEAKRRAQEEKLLKRHEDERDDHEKVMLDIRETQNRLGRAQSYGFNNGGDEDDEEAIGGHGSGRFQSPVEQAKRKEERKRYQFEATASDDEIEDELDDNLNEIADMTKKLKALGTAMGAELDNQNQRLDRLDNKTGNLDNKLYRGTERFKRIK